MPPYRDDPDFYAERTQGIRSSGYDARPQQPTPWYRRPPALIGVGVLIAVVLAAVIFAAVKLATSSPWHPTVTTSLTSTTRAALRPWQSGQGGHSNGPKFRCLGARMPLK